MITRVKAILARPQTEWRVICRESGDAADLFTGYVAIMALIPAVAGFLGATVVARMSVLSGLFSAIFGYLLTFVVVYLIGVLVNALAPMFGGRRNIENALKLAVYSFTPYWLAGVLLVLPGLRFLTIVGLYGAYLMGVGLPVTMQVPRQRALAFAVAIMACAIALALLVGGIQTMIFALRRA